MSNPNRNRGWISVSLIIVAVLAIIIFWPFPACKSETVVVSTRTSDSLLAVNNRLKSDVRKEKYRNDSLQATAEKSDSISTTWKLKYLASRNRIPDFRDAPCDSIRKYVPVIINSCDSTIYHDSVTKQEYRNVIDSDHRIIAKQDSIITNDSLVIVEKDKIIVDKDKTIKKVKRQRNVSIILNAVQTGLLIAK